MTPDPITDSITDFDFELPEELIAQDPTEERGRSRLLVLPRDGGVVTHTTFPHLSDHLRPGDLLVLNNTKVFPARLLGHRVPSGGAIECLLIGQLPTPNSQFPKLPTTQTGEQKPDALGVGTLGVGRLGVGSVSLWDALMHPGQKLKPGARVVFERDGVTLHGEVLDRHFHGRRTLRLWTETKIDVATAIDRIGHVPLPPYIKRADRPADRDRYQTVYASERGSVAAPTAGLHFTEDLLAALAAHGIQRVDVTLHVGYGTFKPVRTERVEDHEVDPEFFTVSDTAAEALTCARRNSRRVIAVGTTSARALESLEMHDDGTVMAAKGQTRLFIRAGHRFQLVGGLITNFHLARSSLLMLVAAFAGRERVLDAYRQAIERQYRFYSYGDAMLIL